MVTHLISFGQSGYYEDLSKDLLNRISKKYPLIKTKVYTEKDLTSKMTNYAMNHARGYGYWRWKPFIILSHLLTIAEDDVLVYVDGRSHFIDERISWFDTFVKTQFKFGFWELSHSEKTYCPYVLFENLNVNENIKSSKQLAATIVLLMKSSESIEIISKWHNFIENNLSLVRINNNHDSRNDPNFVENRHDQSVLSLIVKIQEIDYFRISTETMLAKNTIITHFKPHKSKSKFISSEDKLFLKVLMAPITVRVIRILRKSKRIIRKGLFTK